MALEGLPPAVADGAVVRVGDVSLAPAPGYAGGDSGGVGEGTAPAPPDGNGAGLADGFGAAGMFGLALVGGVLACLAAVGVVRAARRCAPEMTGRGTPLFKDGLANGGVPAGAAKKGRTGGGGGSARGRDSRYLELSEITLGDDL